MRAAPKFMPECLFGESGNTRDYEWEYTPSPPPIRRASHKRHEWRRHQWKRIKRIAREILEGRMRDEIREPTPAFIVNEPNTAIRKS
jgi:hypothetical protein